MRPKKQQSKVLVKNEYGMPTVNGKRLPAFRVISKGKK
jgi:hypothetical protein